MSNIISGRQLRAARILAGLTQREFAKAAEVNERAVRYWEAKENELPTCTVTSLERIEIALREHGIILISSPSAGVRLSIANE